MVEGRAVSRLLPNPLGPDVLGLAVFRDDVQDVPGQEQGVDGVADEAVAVARRVGGLADHPQEALVAVQLDRGGQNFLDLFERVEALLLVAVEAPFLSPFAVGCSEKPIVFSLYFKAPTTGYAFPPILTSPCQSCTKCCRGAKLISNLHPRLEYSMNPRMIVPSRNLKDRSTAALDRWQSAGGGEELATA